METKKKLTHTFYQNLGKLFYAIAASDNQVRKAEFDKLKQLVKSQWLDMDPIVDDFGTDAAFEIEIVFDWLNTQNTLGVDACFDDFVAYKNEQLHLFTSEGRSLILKTAHAIADAFSGINKSELIILAKLDIELKK
ncbi:hypothetical protein [Aestuariibaculum marinum]|uniref:Co-chaperone DjlA N-terminal domain-containing protein n=1 Tax=Aestuariibaculum marinum TaxID=2683592 RepID=A0A8J6U6R7_9FLAO|nr:hypothetical protein [Aestuariibaculum marinum]MBD0822836.1 hypothetical protein [Aestuariibaculum marinum]